MNNTPCKLIKEFVMPLFVKNTYTGDLYKKCFDRFQVYDFYEAINTRIFNGSITRFF